MSKVEIELNGPGEAKIRIDGHDVASQARDERDKALTEAKRLRPLIEPLRAWRAMWQPDSTPYPQEQALIAAVDLLDATEDVGEPLSHWSADTEIVLSAEVVAAAWPGCCCRWSVFTDTKPATVRTTGQNPDCKAHPASKGK